MKKIISLLIVGLLSFGLFGCGAKEEKKKNVTNMKQKIKDEDLYKEILQEDEKKIINKLKGTKGEMNEIKEGEFFNALAGTAPDSKMFYILNKDNETKTEQSLFVKINLNKSDKQTEIEDFVDKLSKLVKYIEDGLITMRYSNLVILMYVDGNYVGNNVSFVVTNNKLEHENTLIHQMYYDYFQKAKQKYKSDKK